MPFGSDPVVGAPTGGFGKDPLANAPATAAPVHPAGAGGGPIADTALAGLDYLGMGLGKTNPFMTMPDQFKQDVAQSHQNIGAMDLPLAVGAYALGPGKILGPAGKLIGGAGIGGMAAEGALAGGASSAIQGDNPVTGALTGAALGGVAGGIGAGVSKALAKPGSIDPAAAIAATGKLRSDAYAALSKAPANPGAIDGVIGRVMNNLDPSVETGMSPGLRSTINNIRGTVQGLDQANMGQVDSWQRQIQLAAQREAHPTDAIVAQKISDGLDGIIQEGGAGGLQDAAQAAHQNYAMAQNLAEWQRKAAAGADLGQAPLTEAEKFYQGRPEYQSLVDLYKKNQSQFDPSWALGHLAAGAMGDIGGALGGFGGHFGGELLGYLGIKPAIKSAFKGMKQNAVTKNIQQLYPQLTGQQLSGAQPGPNVGELLKNLMIGSAY